MAARLSLVLSESDINTIANTSKVTAKLYYYGNGESYNANNPTGTITIDGTSYSFNHDFTKSTSAQLLATKSKTVTHNTDGSKTVNASASFKTGVSLGTMKASSSIVLTKIARASNVAIDKTEVLADGTEVVVITITKMLSTYTDMVTVSLGDYVQTFDAVSESISVTIPEEWIKAISGASAIATVKVSTYSEETLIGSNTVNLTVNVPESVVPIINDVAITEAVVVVASAFSDCFIQGLSQLNVVIDAVGAYGATIRSYSAVIDGVTYIQQAFTSNVLNTAGTLNVAVEVVDSRGRKAQKTIPVKVVEYASPTITAMTYAHWDSETGEQNSGGDSTKITISGKVSSVEEHNTKTLKLKYKSLANEDYIERLVPLSDWTFNVDVIINETDPSVTYEYIAELTDKINTDSPATFRVTTGVVVLSRLAGGKGVTLFGEAEEEGFIVKGGKPSTFSGDINITVDDEFKELFDTAEDSKMQYELLSVLKKMLEKNFMHAITTSDTTLTTTSDTALTLSEYQSSGNVFSIESGGIRVAEDCIAQVTWGAYFSTSYEASDIIHASYGGGSDGTTIRGRMNQRVYSASPYLKVVGSCITNLVEGDLLKLYVRNQTKARGVIGSGLSNTYICVAKL